VCDALLGAMGKGDIGEHFPNTDKALKDISSMALLGKVNDLLQQEGYAVVNVDAVIHAQEPKLSAYKSQMRVHLADTLAIDETAVNIKATTHEGLGSIGSKQGIAASAVALIRKI
ncbi:MAG: 2-C-methyl-D-erythritol 2,4-cyclodiphosphate synthase, partial [Candidatus Omnitrophota bacterium]|nr:2-C-methyl-D-erythritol 2,4-cyclodiphosphate synthase [Candidatus Omnitrophota bacterium]